MDLVLPKPIQHDLGQHIATQTQLIHLGIKLPN